MAPRPLDPTLNTNDYSGRGHTYEHYDYLPYDIIHSRIKLQFTQALKDDV